MAAGAGSSLSILPLSPVRGIELLEHPMARKLTASDRKRLIRIASEMPAGSPERKAILSGLAKAAALPSATVEMFLRVAVSKLTQYDKRLQKRQPNIYRLGHYLGAIEKVEKDVAPYMRDDSPEALEALRKSLLKRFTSSFSGVSDLAPIRATIKQIDEHLSEGLMPTLTRRSRKAYGGRRRPDNDKTRKLLESVIDRAVSEWEDATSELYLNDLSKAYNQIDGFVNIAQRAENRLGDLFARIDGGDYADFYDDLMSEIYSLHEAYYSAQNELQYMVDDGLADEGNEDYVMRKMEDEVVPILEDAIAEFKRIRVPRK